jgi:predicted DNA-binding transcriptional regulator AlpA
MKGSSLPFGYLLGALNRMQSAEYVNVCPSVFDEMVADGRMPKPVVLSERRFGWIQRELDAALARLPRKTQTESDAPVGGMSDSERKALENFVEDREAAKAKKLASQR